MQNNNRQKFYTNLYFRNNGRIYSGTSLLMIPEYKNLRGDGKGFITTNTICIYSLFASNALTPGQL